MFKHTVVKDLIWKVTQGRIELEAPERLLHSLLTSSLILIRMYRSEGAGRGCGGHVPLLCVWWLIVPSWQEEGRANGKRIRDQEMYKGPLPVMGVTQAYWALILCGLLYEVQSAVSVSPSRLTYKVYHICDHAENSKRLEEKGESAVGTLHSSSQKPDLSFINWYYLVSGLFSIDQFEQLS